MALVTVGVIKARDMVLDMDLLMGPLMLPIILTGPDMVHMVRILWVILTGTITNTVMVTVTVMDMDMDMTMLHTTFIAIATLEVPTAAIMAVPTPAKPLCTAIPRAVVTILTGLAMNRRMRIRLRTLPSRLAPRLLLMSRVREVNLARLYREIRLSLRIPPSMAMLMPALNSGQGITLKVSH
jgi:hypothetical protein